MSVFSGPQGKGAMRAHRKNRREQAIARAIEDYADGTGRYYHRTSGTWILRASPLLFIPRRDHTPELLSKFTKTS